MIYIIISFLIALVAVSNAADLVERGYHITLSLTDCLLAIRRSNLFYYLIPLTCCFSCFHYERELFIDQYSIRFHDIKKVWTTQFKSVSILSLLYSMIFNTVGLLVGLHYTVLLHNWDRIESLCYISYEKIIDVNPILVISVSYLSAVFILMFYSLLFLVLIWGTASRAGGLLICAVLVSADATCVNSGTYISPSGFISNDYWNWSIYTPFKLIFFGGVIVFLYWLGTKVVWKKEFL